jgi:hypothetical protein
MTKPNMTIRFSTDKNGKRRAHYWGLARRWLPISIDEAELRLATGRAVRQGEPAEAAATLISGWSAETARARVGGTMGS